MPTGYSTATRYGGQVASQIAIIDVLQEQLRLSQQAREERNRLLTMLEIEQSARRDLEQKLLAGPGKAKKKK